MVTVVFHANNNNSQSSRNKGAPIKVVRHFVPFLGLENVDPVANCLTVDNLYKVSAAKVVQGSGADGGLGHLFYLAQVFSLLSS